MNIQEPLPGIESWPKYYANQLIINKNPEARIALTTGWTKKKTYGAVFQKNPRKKFWFPVNFILKKE